MEELSFKLQTLDFEGPMDLILHLIEKNKVDIMDIPIASITDQYFEYLEKMQQSEAGRRLDTMSDFLVMAATLLDIKARMLLPPAKDEEGEEIDPRSELVEKLLEYKMYKAMSYELKGREDEALMTMYHSPDIPKEVRAYREPVNLDALLGGVTLPQLRKVFEEVMKRQNDRMDPVRSSFGRIEKEEVDSRQVMRSVSNRIRKKKKCSFRSLLSSGSGKMYVVVTFLTILELMRMGRVSAEQDTTFGEIMITAKDETEWTEPETEAGEGLLDEY